MGCALQIHSCVSTPAIMVSVFVRRVSQLPFLKHESVL